MAGRIIFGVVTCLFATGYVLAGWVTPDVPKSLLAQAAVEPSIFTAKGLAELTCAGGLIGAIFILLWRVVPSMIKEQTKIAQSHDDTIKALITDHNTTTDTVCQRYDETLRTHTAETKEAYHDLSKTLTDLTIHCKTQGKPE